MTAIHEAIEKLASAVMMADDDPHACLSALDADLIAIIPLLKDAHPRCAQLAVGLQSMTTELNDEVSPTTLETLTTGIGLLQRLYAASERGSEQIDDPKLYDRIVASTTEQLMDNEAPAIIPTDIRAIDQEAFSYFSEEAEEHLSNAETIWLDLEKDAQDTSQIDTLFRIYHTLKGAAGYAYLSDVVALTHGVEGILDSIRSGQMQMQRPVIEMGLESVDLLRALITHVRNMIDGEQTDAPILANFSHQLAQITEHGPTSQSNSQTIPPEVEKEENKKMVDVGKTDSDAEETIPKAVTNMDEVDSISIVSTEDNNETVHATESPELIAIGQIEESFNQMNIDDLSTLGVLNGDLEDLATALAQEMPLASLVSISMAKILEKLILDECPVDEALDLLSYGCGMLRRLRLDFEASGGEAIDDHVIFDQLTALAEIEGDGIEENTASQELRPEAIVATGGDLSNDDLLEEDSDPPEEEQTIGVEVDQEIFTDFSSEAEEHLNNAETALISLEGHPDDDELLNTIFRAFHTIKGASSFLNLTDITRVAHSVEDVLDSARKKQLELNQAITDVILEAIDLLKELFQNVAAQIESGEVHPRPVTEFTKKVGLVASNKEVPVPTPASDQPSGPAASTPASAPTAQKETAPSPDKKQQASSAKHRDLHVRVGTEKLDALVNIVGELVIAQTQVSQNPDVVATENQKLVKDMSQLMKISSDLQEIAMSMRMVPIRATFERMARMVRDLARKCDKQVEFSTSGDDTELDKNVVEEIVDPLTHMIRNSVDHGVEHSSDRLTAGKSEKGHVSLHAYHKGGNVVIELRDDGDGINREKVLKKAMERGLVQPGEELTDDQINNLVFHPGLSTAEKISDVSGRGVGMDVVRRNIEMLRGKVEVQSEPGKGSVFRIKLPLTLAIIDGMIIGVGPERYILPLTSIISSLRPHPDQICSVMGKGEMVKVQDDLYPLLRLHERFDVTPRYTDPWEGLVMLIESEGERCCLLVDELIGLQQVVIKGLDEDLRQDPCLSGCAILGDGCIGLILDANGLVSHRRDAIGTVYK
ncbi:MAG: two-component system chemotaxis sensor kinase CheA [Planctomycetota bacterium]|jgi:two-component system chemotaxis sensor kinase CheA